MTTAISVAALELFLIVHKNDHQDLSRRFRDSNVSYDQSTQVKVHNQWIELRDLASLGTKCLY